MTLPGEVPEIQERRAEVCAPVTMTAEGSAPDVNPKYPVASEPTSWIAEEVATEERCVVADEPEIVRVPAAASEVYAPGSVMVSVAAYPVRVTAPVAAPEMRVRQAVAVEPVRVIVPAAAIDVYDPAAVTVSVAAYLVRVTAPVAAEETRL